MPTPTTQTQIDFLIDLISQGKSYTQSLDVFGRKWTLSESTFKRRWDLANQQYVDTQKTLNDTANDVTLDEKIEAQKTALKRKAERLQILNNKFNELAETKPIKVKTKDGKEISITKADYLKAIEVMAKLDDRISKAEGTDAPTKTANTDSDGKYIEAKSTFTDNQVDKLLDVLAKK